MLQGFAGLEVKRLRVTGVTDSCNSRSSWLNSHEPRLCGISQYTRRIRTSRTVRVCVCAKIPGLAGSLGPSGHGMHLTQCGSGFEPRFTHE